MVAKVRFIENRPDLPGPPFDPPTYDTPAPGRSTLEPLSDQADNVEQV